MGQVMARKKKLDNQGPLFALNDSINATQITFPETENSMTFIKDFQEGYYIPEETMIRIYEQQKELMNGKCLITTQINQEVKAICKVINEDFGYTMHKSLAPFQRSFFEKFVEIAQYGRHKKWKTIDDRIVGHFSIIMRIFPIIIQYIENEDTAVFDLLKQIALNHANMRIQGSEFKIFFVSLLNILIHEEFITKEHLKPIIIFFMTISNYLTQYLDNYCKCGQKKEGMDRYFSRYRRNYRLLKQWRELIDQLNNDIETLDTKNEFLKNDNTNVELASQNSESWETLFEKSCLHGCFYHKQSNKNETPTTTDYTTTNVSEIKDV